MAADAKQEQLRQHEAEPPRNLQLGSFQEVRLWRLLQQCAAQSPVAGFDRRRATLTAALLMFIAMMATERSRGDAASGITYSAPPRPQRKAATDAEKRFQSICMTDCAAAAAGNRNKLKASSVPIMERTGCARHLQLMPPSESLALLSPTQLPRA